jgi:hypothetical protein
MKLSSNLINPTRLADHNVGPCDNYTSYDILVEGVVLYPMGYFGILGRNYPLLAMMVNKR